MKTAAKKRDWWRVLSPGVIALVLTLSIIVVSYADSQATGGWSLIGILVFAPVAGMVLVADVILKLVLKCKTVLVWVIELLLLVLIYLLWVSRYF